MAAALSVPVVGRVSFAVLVVLCCAAQLRAQTGTFGIWHGTDDGRMQIEINREKNPLSREDLAAMREARREAERRLKEERKIEAKTAAILASMLLQMASGSVYETVFIGDWETEDLKKVKKDAMPIKKSANLIFLSFD